MKNSHYVGLTVLALATSGASAAVSVFENIDIAIPSTFEGIYLDLENNSTNSTSSSGTPSGDAFTISYTEPAAGDWDLNFFFGGIGIAHNSSINPYRGDASDNLSPIHALGVGESIDGSTATLSGALPLTTPDFGGSGIGSGGNGGVSTSSSHLGTNPEQFEANNQEYLGFVLDPGPNEKYGWMLVTLQDDGSAGTIHSFAFSDTPLAVGAIPEPTTAILALLGLIPVFRRKR